MQICARYAAIPALHARGVPRRRVRRRADMKRPAAAQWWIYALCDPIAPDVRVRYVGASRTPATRLQQHIATARRPAPNLPVHRWIRELLDSGLVPELHILQAVPLAKPWQAAERRWIASFAGSELLNVAPGGHSWPPIPSQARASARAKLKERVFTDEHRARISAAKTGVARTDAGAVAERLRAVAKANVGKRMDITDEERARRREAALQLAAGNSARWAALSSEERARRSDAAREQMRRVWAERRKASHG